MKDFMLIYKGGDPNWMENTPKAEMQNSMQEWDTWIDDLRGKNQLVTGGAPMTFTGKAITPDARITDLATTPLEAQMTGYSIVKAEDFDEAASIAQDCPIFSYPNTTVEVRQLIDMG